MPRKFKQSKLIICLFYEGESEYAYAKFLNDLFSDVAVIKCSNKSGLFEESYDKFTKDKRYSDNIDQINEVWYFFDVEQEDVNKWESRLKLINKIRKLKRKPGIKVRLLMTTGCIEYWYMLHYQKYQPIIKTPADKKNILDQLIKIVPNYKKGDLSSTYEIAKNYNNAVCNSKEIFKELISDGMPGLEDTDIRNEWLYKSSKTFSTVHEAICYLEKLRK